MAVGDTATSAGLPVLTGAEDLRDGWVEINRTRDEVANLMLISRQRDTFDTLTNMFVQVGIGKISGAASATLSEVVNFGSAFGSTPSVILNFIGQKAAGAFSTTGLSQAQSLLGSAQKPDTTSFTAYIYQTTGSNLSAANDYYYSWIAFGARP